MTSALVAPCGMNCRLCRAYNREKKACPGCNGEDRLKSKSCAACRIKNCRTRKAAYCFTCGKYPCAALNRLDKRYRTKYRMSMIDNLEYIKKSGIRKFITNEETRWACPKCGELLCVHKEYCISCGHTWR